MTTEPPGSTGSSAFDLSGKVAVVTGGSGALGRTVAAGLVRAGARVALVARTADDVERAAHKLAGNGEPLAIGLAGDVTSKEEMNSVREAVTGRWGRLDILVNGAGGNQPAGTVPPEGTFFDVGMDGFRRVLDLNLMGTVLPSSVFGRAMGPDEGGKIVNVSSMTAMWPMTRVAAYAAAKAGVDNFTRWLADHLARSVSPHIRVNAIAPGFFLGDQNRALLTNPDGSLTPRGQAVVSRTPMGRLGTPEDLVGAVVFLCSPASAFITGAVLPVDGGFSAGAGI